MSLEISYKNFLSIQSGFKSEKEFNKNILEKIRNNSLDIFKLLKPSNQLQDLSLSTISYLVEKLPREIAYKVKNAVLENFFSVNNTEDQFVLVNKIEDPEEQALLAYFLTGNDYVKLFENLNGLKISAISNMKRKAEILKKLVQNTSRNVLIANHEKLGLNEKDYSLFNLFLIEEDRALRDFRIVFDSMPSMPSHLETDLCKNFSKLIAKNPLELGRYIALHGDKVAKSLVKNINFKELQNADLTDRLELYKSIASQGHKAARSLLERFHELGLEKVSLKDLVDFCQSIASQGHEAARLLLGRFHELGLERVPLSDRLDLCKLIVSQGREAARGFMYNFEKLGLGKIPLKDRLDLYESIILQDKQAAGNFLFFLKERGLGKIPQKNLVDLYKLCISQGDSPAKLFLEYSGKLNLSELPQQDILDLCKLCISHGDWPSIGVLENFDYLKLSELSQQDLLDLFKLIVTQPKMHMSTSYLLNNFENLGLTKLPQQEIFDLCKAIVLQGEGEEISTLLKKLDKLGLEDASDQLDLCKLAASKGSIAQSTLVRCVDSLGLGLKERLDLYQHIAENGGIDELIFNFDKLGLEKAKLEELVDLFTLIFSQKYYYDLFLNYDKLGITKAPPHKLTAFWTKIASQNYQAAYNVSIHLEQLGLKQPEDILQVMKVAVTQEKPLSNFPLRNIFIGPLMKRVNTIKDCQKRLDLCKQTASIDPKLILHMVLEKLEMKGVSPQEFLDFCKYILSHTDMHSIAEFCTLPIKTDFLREGVIEIVNRIEEKERLNYLRNFALLGEMSALVMLKNFDKFDLDTISPQSLVVFLKFLALQGHVYHLIENIDKLGLQKVSLKERLGLYKFVALQESGSYGLALNVGKLGLEKADPQDLLDFLKLIVSKCENAAYHVAKNFDQLPLEKVPAQDLKELCYLIAKKGGYEGLAKGFHTLGKVDLVERLYLCKLIVSQNGEKAFAKNLDKFIAETEKNPACQRQILLELLTYPSFVECLPTNVTLPKSLLPLTTFFTKMEETLFDEKELESLRTFLKNHVPFLVPHLKKIEETKNAVVKSQLTQWLAYAAGVMYDLSEEKIAKISESKIVDDILSYHATTRHRFTLIRELSFMDLADLEKLSSRRKEKLHARLASVALLRLKNLGFSEKAADTVFDKIKAIRGFKDGKQLAKLLNLLFQLQDERIYQTNEPQVIENKLIEILGRERPKKGQKTKEKYIDLITKDLQVLTNIQKIFRKDELIHLIKSNKNPHKIFEEKLSLLFGIEDSKHCANYEQTFGSFRNNIALFTYLGSIDKLQKDDKEKAKTALNIFVDSVLQETSCKDKEYVQFRKVRYDMNQSPHLEKLFKNNESLKNAWLETKDPKVLKNRQQSSDLDFKKILKQKILIDRHLDHHDFPVLVKYLQDHGEQIKNPKDPKELFQNLAIQLCERKVSVDQFLEGVEMLNIPLGEFANDLEALKPRMTSTNLEISESDDPCDLLLIGTEIKGSCQRVDGSPEENKCLLSYLLNGEIRPIVVKKDERLVARSLLRLLWDDKNQTPVLLLERLYSNFAMSFIEEGILKWAMKKAKKMGIPLVSKELGKGKPYQGSIEFLGGLAPFVYSDATGGSHRDPFKIPDPCHVLYLP